MPDRALLRVLAGEPVWPPPVWLMRQAGRYLPEYRAVRAEAGGFLNMCYTPEHAVEVTLQPIRRFGFDAAILFSDILVVPDALGRAVRFEVGEGPRLDPLAPEDIARLTPDRVLPHLAPVFEAVRRLRAGLPDETTLIGFCGAPWTVATYMIAGRGTPDQAEAKAWAYGAPDRLDALIDVLVDASVDYLAAQLDAGADCVQLFDTWAGALDPEGVERFVVGPARRIVDGLRAKVTGARVIGFPKGLGPALPAYAERTGVDAVGFDWSVDPAWVSRAVTKPVQGNLDPMRLLDPEGMAGAVDRLLAPMRGRPYVFNLGHGILQQTPISAVERLLERVRGAA
jgi:uroporphyrinogen decarboxylase